MSKKTINSIPFVEGMEPGQHPLKVCTLGQPDSGKSSLIGVLTSGLADDGNGSARLPVFSHAHERATGRTSSISSHLFGYKYDTEGNVSMVYGSEAKGDTGVNTSASSVQSATSKRKNVSWTHVVKNTDRLVHLTDLCGHESYFKTTVKGLLGESPDFVILIVNGSASVSLMTSVHLQTCRALGLPIVVVVTKIDKTPVAVLKNTKTEVENAIRSIGRYPDVIKTPTQALKVGALVHKGVVPIVFTSLVTMQYMDLLHYTLLSIPTVPQTSCLHGYQFDTNANDGRQLQTVAPQVTPEGTVQVGPADACTTVSRMSICDVYSSHGSGIIISGTLISGVLSKGARGFIGPDGRGKFTPVSVVSVQCDRVPVEEAVAGSMTSALVQLDKDRMKEAKSGKVKMSLNKGNVRKGMIFILQNQVPKCPYTFTACIYVSPKDSTTITKNYEAVLHLHYSQTTCKVTSIDADPESVARITSRGVDAPRTEEPSQFERITHSVTGRYPPVEGYEVPVRVEKKEKKSSKSKKKKEGKFDDEKAQLKEEDGTQDLLIQQQEQHEEELFVAPGACAIVTLRSLKPLLSFPGDVFLLRHGRIAATGVVVESIQRQQQ